MDRTRLQVQRSELPRRIQGGTEESPWARALTRRGASTAQGARGAVGAMRKLPFGPTAQGSFNATLLRSLDFCTCPHVDPPLPRRRFWPERFTPGRLCCDWWLEIRASCEVFSNSGLFLGRKTNSFRDSGKRERHLKSGQKSIRYSYPPVGRLGDKTET